MGALAGPFLVTATLLAVAGALKVIRPFPTARALREMGLPASAIGVRIGAAIELGIAAGALAGGSRVFAALVAMSYVAFAGFVGAALRGGAALSSCGCFGVRDTPPTVIHLVFNLVAAAVGATVALTGTGSGGLPGITATDGSLLLRLSSAALTVSLAWFAYMAFTLPPRLQIARPGGRPDRVRR